MTPASSRAGSRARISARACGPPVEAPSDDQGLQRPSRPGRSSRGRPARDPRPSDPRAGRSGLPTSRPISSILCRSTAAPLISPRGPERRRVDRVERAVAHRLIHLAQVPAHRRRDHQDRARRLAHDPPRRLDPVDPRHEQVHQDQVGRVLPRHRDRLGAVAGRPDDLVLRRRQHHPAQRLASQHGVVDDPDSHGGRLRLSPGATRARIHPRRSRRRQREDCTMRSPRAERDGRAHSCFEKLKKTWLMGGSWSTPLIPARRASEATIVSAPRCTSGWYRIRMATTN